MANKAKAPKAAKGKKGHKKARKFGNPYPLLLTIAMIIISAMSLQAGIIALIGLLPSFAVSFSDTTPHKSLAATVIPLNGIATLPYVMEVFSSRQGFFLYQASLGDTMMWLIIYGASGAGWVLYMALPAIVRSSLLAKIHFQRQRLETNSQRLQTEWHEMLLAPASPKTVPSEPHAVQPEHPVR